MWILPPFMSNNSLHPLPTPSLCNTKAKENKNFFPDSLSDKGRNVFAFRATSSVELEAVVVLPLVVEVLLLLVVVV